MRSIDALGEAFSRRKFKLSLQVMTDSAREKHPEGKENLPDSDEHSEKLSVRTLSESKLDSGTLWPNKHAQEDGLQEGTLSSLSYNQSIDLSTHPLESPPPMVYLKGTESLKELNNLSQYCDARGDQPSTLKKLLSEARGKPEYDSTGTLKNQPDEENHGQRSVLTSKLRDSQSREEPGDLNSAPKATLENNSRLIELAKSYQHRSSEEHEKIMRSALQQINNLFQNNSFCSLDSVLTEAAAEVQSRLKNEYQRLRGEMQGSVSRIVAFELQKASCSLETMIYQLESMRDLARDYEKKLAKKDRTISELSSEISEVKLTFDQQRDIDYKARKKFCTQMALNHAKRRLVLRAWTCWKRAIESSWKDRVYRRLVDQANEVCVNLRREHARIVAELEEKLRLSEAKLIEADRQQHESHMAMKSALMRGVCALNMETMSVLQPETENLPVGYPETAAAAATVTTATATPTLLRSLDVSQEELLRPQPRPAKDNGHNEIALGLPRTTNCFASTDAWPRTGPPTSSTTESLNFRQCRPQQSVATSSALAGNSYQASTFLQSTARSFDYSRFPVKPGETSLEPLYSRSQSQLYRDFERGYLSQATAHSGGEHGDRINSIRAGQGEPSAPNVVNAFGGKVLRACHVGVGDGIAVVTASVPKVVVRSPASSAAATANSVLRAHTVQLGAPAGPSTHSSSVLAGVHVQRHRPSSEIDPAPCAGFVSGETSKYQQRTAEYSPSVYTQGKVLNSTLRRKI
ncbi:Centrosomal protein poc5 [Sparganum proliferum]